MKTTTKPLEDRQLGLTIEVGEEQTNQALQRAARQIAKQVDIPGFRKGKAPYELIVERYGEETIRREAADLLIEDVYKEALEQEDIDPFAPGSLEEMEIDSMTFQFTVPLHPTIDLGDYRKVRVKTPKPKVTKKQVKAALEGIREEAAILELVDRPAGVEDGVVIDLLAQMADGTEILKGEGVRLILEAGSPDPAPGFAEAVAGMAAGDERTFTLTLGDEFPQEALRGQDAEFSIKMIEVYDSTLPALDDDLARTVGNYDSFKELEKGIREQLEEEAQQEADVEYAAQVLERVIEGAQVVYPPIVLEREIDAVVEELEHAIKRQAPLSLEDYLRLQGKTMDEVREEVTPNAEQRLKRALVLGEVVDAEQLQVDDAEVLSQIDAISEPWGVRADEVRQSLFTDAGRQAIVSRLLGNKAVQRLVAIAKGENPEVGPAGGSQDAEEDKE